MWTLYSRSGSSVFPMQPGYRFEVIPYWSYEDQAFVAEVPELPGCVADGANYAATLSNAEVVIAEWIETARGRGRLIPEPKVHLLFA